MQHGYMQTYTVATKIDLLTGGEKPPPNNLEQNMDIKNTEGIIKDNASINVKV